MPIEKLKIDRSKDTFTVQTQKCSFQYYSESPILEIIKYLEEYQLYRLNGAISSMNLRIFQYIDTVQAIPKQIQDKFQKRIKKVTQMCEQLLLSAQMHKVIELHYYGSIILGFQSNVYGSCCDPYKFDINQFKDQYEKVLRFLQKDWSALDPAVTAEHRKQFEQHLQKIKKKSQQKKKNCIKAKVQQPYLAQNKLGTVVNATDLFRSYLEAVEIQSCKQQESLYLSFYNVSKQIARYSEFQGQCFLTQENYAYNIARVYNVLSQRKKMAKQAEFQIKPKIFFDMKAQGDMHEMQFLGYGTKSKPILQNSIRNITFKNQIIVHSVIQRNDHTVRYIDDFESESCLSTKKLAPLFPVQKKPELNNPSDLHYFQQRKVKDRNCYVNKNIVQYKKFAKNFEAFKDYNTPFKQEDDRYAKFFNRQNFPFLQGQYHEQRRQREKKKQLQDQSVLPWKNLFVQKNILSFPYTELIKEEMFWQYRSDRKVHLSAEYCKVAQKPRRQISYIRGQKIQDRQKREEDLNKKWNQERIKSNQAFQSKMKEEQTMKRNIYQQIYKKKTYAKFAEILKLDPVLQKDGEHFVRYGLKFNVQFQKNQPELLNKVFFYYFKQRYYKQNETAIISTSIPLLMSEKQIQYEKFLQEASLKRIMQLTRIYPFFFLIYHDLIYFQKVKNRGEERTYNFIIVCYTNPLNSQKFLYQMRRRINIKMKENIISQYYNPQRFQSNPMSKIYSRVEVMHRFLHKRHRETQNLSESEAAGERICKQLWQEIIQWQTNT